MTTPERANVADTATDDPVVRARRGPSGAPIGAIGSVRVHASIARLWSVVSDVDAYAKRVPMIARIDRHGDRITVQLKFKVAFFSVGFAFVADATEDREHRLDLRWVSGEPRDIHLGFELLPGASADDSVLRVEAGFDVLSLGWLAKYFLKHHPEIQFGIYPGVVLALLDSMRRAAEQP
jgi:hypothetical protein